MRPLLLLPLLFATPALAETLSPALQGKSYIVELSSTQSSSGYGDYLLPPLLKALAGSGMTPWKTLGPGADVVVNVVPASDVGQWVGTGDQRQWLYTVSVTVGISPESYAIPFEGTPAFGVTAKLMTPNGDREDELDCLIRMAALTALRDYRPEGAEVVDGQSCLRR